MSIIERADTLHDAQQRFERARHAWQAVLDREAAAERLPEPSRELALTELRDDKLAAAHEFQAAIDALVGIGVARANEKMARLVERYRSNSDVIEKHRRGIEKATVELIARLWAFEQAVETESQIRSKLIQEATEGARDIAGADLRTRLGLDRLRTPTAVAVDGSWSSIPRPNCRTALGKGRVGEPGRSQWFDRLYDIVRYGPVKGLFEAPEALRPALAKALRALTESR